MAPPPPNADVSMVGANPENSQNQSVEGKLIEGWDPPAAVRHLLLEFKHNICLQASVSAIERLGEGSSSSRTETDSHANMIVVGRHCYYFEKWKGD